MAVVGVPGASNNAATGTWAALATGAAMSVAGPATSRICPTAAPKKVFGYSADLSRSLPRADKTCHTLPMHLASASHYS